MSLHLPKSNAIRHQLPNGLTLILLADQSAPVVSCQAWVACGSIHEQEWLGSGMSHLIEHMLFKGTRNLSGRELARAIQSAGGQWNAYTTYERTVYYIDGPASATDLFIETLCDMVFFPSFPKDEFESEKDVIRREIEMGLDDPYNASHQLLFSTIYQRDPRRFPIIGHRQRFDEIQHHDMLSFHQRHYTPSQVTLVIAGDFELNPLLDKLDKLTADIPLRLNAPPQPVIEPRQLGSRFAEEEFPIPDPKLTLAWRAPSIEHPDSIPLNLLFNILGDGQSSLLYQQHRETTGNALEIYSSLYQTPGCDGVALIGAECKSSQLRILENEILGQLDSLTVEQLTQQLEKTKRRALAAQFKSQNTANGKASNLANNWHVARSLDYSRECLEQIQATQPEDLIAARDNWLIRSSFTRTILRPKTSQIAAPPSDEPQRRETPRLHTLSNGLRLVLTSDQRLPTVSFSVAIQGGLSSENKLNNGISSLHAACLLKGTAQRTAAQIASCLEDLGGSISATAGNNSLTLNARCLSPDAETALLLISEILQSPRFPETAIEREKSSQLAELEEALTDPLSVAFSTSRRAVFGQSPYALDSLGTPDSLANLNSDSLQNYHQSLLNAKNMVVSIVGDIEMDALVALAEKTLGTIPSYQEASSPPLPDYPKQLTEINEGLQDKNQTVIIIAFPSGSIHDPNRAAYDLLSDYLSDMGGPLFTRIRDELGLAYYVGATQLIGLNAGMFAFYLGTSKEQSTLAKNELLSQINKLRDTGLTPDELASAKNNHLASFVIGNQSNHRVAQLIALDTLYQLGPHHHLDFEQRISAITLDSLNQLAQKIFAHPPTICIVEPAN